MAEDLNTLRAWLNHVEPQALVMGGDEFVMKVSQAISAKRQAAALERLSQATERVADVLEKVTFDAGNGHEHLVLRAWNAAAIVE